MTTTQFFRGLLRISSVLLILFPRDCRPFAPNPATRTVISAPTSAQFARLILDVICPETDDSTHHEDHEYETITSLSGEPRHHEPDDDEKPMKIVLPSDADAVTVDLLRRLDLTLRRSGVRLHFDRLIHLGSTSVRKIQAGRYEVFVSAEGKECTAADWIFAKVAEHAARDRDGSDSASSAETVKRAILGYARRQADASDPRRHRGDSGNHRYQYDNFALLVSYGTCPPQRPHIDALHPNMQFGLVVTDGSPGTLWFEPRYPIRTALDLRQAWRRQQPRQPTEQPYCDCDDDLVALMDGDERVRSWLRDYGNVLSPDFRGSGPNHGAPLATGNLCALPGGVVHAGPACERFRAILFFTGHPARAAAQGRNGVAVVAPYNPDTQYFGSVLLADVIARLWPRLAVRHRRYLLGRLVEYIARAPADHRNMHMHLPQGSVMHQFAKHIETTMLGPNDTDNGGYDNDNNSMEKYLEQFASHDCFL